MFMSAHLCGNDHREASEAWCCWSLGSQADRSSEGSCYNILKKHLGLPLLEEIS